MIVLDWEGNGMYGGDGKHYQKLLFRMSGWSALQFGFLHGANNNVNNVGFNCLLK